MNQKTKDVLTGLAFMTAWLVVGTWFAMTINKYFIKPITDGFGEKDAVIITATNHTKLYVIDTTNTAAAIQFTNLASGTNWVFYMEMPQVQYGYFGSTDPGHVFGFPNISHIELRPFTEVLMEIGASKREAELLADMLKEGKDPEAIDIIDSIMLRPRVQPNL